MLIYSSGYTRLEKGREIWRYLISLCAELEPTEAETNYLNEL